MKLFKLLIGLFALVVVCSACGDFLSRKPLDQVTEDFFFKDPNDLKTYVNRFYNVGLFEIYTKWGNDYISDNMITGDINERLAGTRVLANNGGISYNLVRDINYFFDHYKKVEKNNSLTSYKQYVGEAHFFRALIYFNLLKQYGDVLWLNHTVGPNSELLYAPRTPRQVVANKIIADLDTAATLLAAERTNGFSRINKWMALLLQSRVALYEGTWEKYHQGDPFGVNNPTPEKYFKKVVEATTKIMESGLYSIYSTGHPDKDYYNLFTKAQDSYASNPEVMFWKQYNNELVIASRDINYRMENPSGHGITKSLADAYLCVNGKPIAGNALFKGYSSLTLEAKNRDPRFGQTIALPNDIWKLYENGDTLYYTELYAEINTSQELKSPTGYVIRKGYDYRMGQHTPQYEESPSIIYRYAEVLLNFAEAKAELGTITQADLNKSINKLRDRVGMPPMDYPIQFTDPKWNFPNLSPIINEIRRERRIELAGEGFRWDDIARWAAADEFIVGQRPKGAKASRIEFNPYPVDENGFLDPYQNIIPNGYQFQLDRDYLDPISKEELALNEDLEQNPGWGD